jgi:hypothetical protein
MTDGKEPAKTRKRRYTLSRLIEIAVAHLCPGCTWEPPKVRKGRMEVEVVLPTGASVDTKKPTV